MWAQREPAVTHIHIVSYKTALVTLANAKSVLLKGQGNRYNNEPSGPGSSSPPETQTLHHLQPGVSKGRREWEGRETKRQIVQILLWQRKWLKFIMLIKHHWTEIKREQEKQRDKRVGDVKSMPWRGGCKTRQNRVEHKPTFPYEMTPAVISIYRLACTNPMRVAEARLK